MKKLIKQIVLIIVFIMLFTISVNAETVNLVADKTLIKSGEEVSVKLNADKNMQIAMFHIEYDKEKLQFIEEDLPGVTLKDYPEDGVVRIVYLDMSQKGTQELSFKFKAKENKGGSCDLSVTNFSVEFADDFTEYNETNLKNSNFKTTITIQNTLSTKIIIITCIIVVLIIAIIVSIVIYKKTKNSKK